MRRTKQQRTSLRRALLGGFAATASAAILAACGGTSATNTPQAAATTASTAATSAAPTVNAAATRVGSAVSGAAPTIASAATAARPDRQCRLDHRDRRGDERGPERQRGDDRRDRHGGGERFGGRRRQPIHGEEAERRLRARTATSATSRSSIPASAAWTGRRPNSA